ncbi:alkaline phosphatase family protein [Dyella psychrodurans]|nr:alkaline phosphatase family protein [Dyella psychrodurans]
MLVKRKSIWLGTLAAACLSGLFASSAFASDSGNLLVDGDGESGTCTTDWSAVNTVPGWTVTQGSPSIVCYSIGRFNTPGSGSGGNAFIADGPYGDSALRQNVDVSSAATAIDGGNITYNLSGWLGGYTVYNGQAVVTATFLDASGKPLGTPAQLAGVNASARGLESGFIAKSTTGSIPAGTRTISVLLQFTDTSASYNIGYADNLALTLSTPVTAPTLKPPVSNVPAFDHVFVVMMENTDYSEVIGDTTDAPFINSLANQGTLLANASGVYHPSDENYLAIAGGNTFVQGAIYYPNIKVTAPNIADEIEAAGKTWKAYEQGMGTPCNTSNNHDSYYEPDDAPFINFTDIASNPARCAAHLFDTTQLTTDLQSASTTPNFAWIAADDYYDGESSGDGSSTSLKVQNGWLQQTLQPIFNSPAWTQQRSLLILTWDESASSTGNHIATILVGSPGTVQAGAISNTSYNHYSSGRTIENALGIAPLTSNDQYAQPINDAFVATAPITTATLSSTMPSVSQGTYVHVDYATPASKLNSENWIGIYAAGSSPGNGSSASWQYVSAASGTATFDTSGLSPGTYSVWYCYDNGYTVLAGPVTLNVTSP